MKKRTPAKTRMRGPGTVQEQQLNVSTNGTWHRIATKAYELYEQRGRLDGRDLDDWLIAEEFVNGMTK